jgi:hypothetical protein
VVGLLSGWRRERWPDANVCSVPNSTIVCVRVVAWVGLMMSSEQECMHVSMCKNNGLEHSVLLCHPMCALCSRGFGGPLCALGAEESWLDSLPSHIGPMLMDQVKGRLQPLLRARDRKGWKIKVIRY